MKRIRILGSSDTRGRVPILLFLFTLFFYWRVLFGNRHGLPWDASDFFYPYLAFIHEELRHFHFPIWDPFVMSGFPIIGDPEAQIFYPFNWLMVLLHPLSPLPYKTVEVMEISHFFLAGLFMYWLAKDFTKDDLSAMLGGVLFMSSGAMVAHTQHYASVEAMAWYPLVFLLARRGLLEKNFYWTACAGLFMGMENLVGHLQHAVYLGLLLFLYFAYEACAGPHRRRLWPHWIIHLTAVGVFGAGLAFVQIIPTAQLGPQSIRTYLTFSDVTDGNELRFLLTLFLPNMFGGLSGVPYNGPGDPSVNYVFLTVPGCLLALVGLVAMARRRNFFWLGLILLTIELSLGRGGFLGTLVYRTPGLNMFRQMPIFFDLGNFALCLMAAIGTQELLDRNSRKFYQRWYSAVVVGVLLVAFSLGLRYRLADKVPGWHHMLLVLAASAVLFHAWFRAWLRPRMAAVAMLMLMAFELCYYSRDKWFNFELNNPWTNLAYNYAGQRRESLEFLRSDRANDFRVAGFDGSPWGSNGCNVWRLNGIFGWNPVMLRNYQDTIRQVIHTNDAAQPYGSDHRIESSVIDLLGVKYLVVNAPSEEQMRLTESKKFEKVFAEPNWRTIYRNKDFLARTWFYPRAYVMPDRAAVLATLNSHWFQARGTLLFAAPDLPRGLLQHLEPLKVITLPADKVSAASAGRAENDPDCASARPVYKYWEGTGNWLRFDLDAVPEPGRYLLLAEYVAAVGAAPPVLVAEVEQDGQPQSSGPIVLPRTAGWRCKSTRSAELGEFGLAAGAAKIKIMHLKDPAVGLFALRLVRLPDAGSGSLAPSTLEENSSAASTLASFRDFDVQPSTYAFTADLKRDGFVLANEIYYPGWEASVDGQGTDILPADYAFRALALPAGSHRIVMSFHPPRLLVAGSISLLTLGGLFCLLVPRRRNKLNNKERL
ncbi:MAG TPA: YfhO family protein [Acidobacteriota bacterium]|nr:YfhO family protein [Acidobacteriota bacterium]